MLLISRENWRFLLIFIITFFNLIWLIEYFVLLRKTQKVFINIFLSYIDKSPFRRLKKERGSLLYLEIYILKSSLLTLALSNFQWNSLFFFCFISYVFIFYELVFFPKLFHLKTFWKLLGSYLKRKQTDLRDFKRTFRLEYG